MSFIDQIKKRKESEGKEATAKPNPFAARKNPLAGRNPLLPKKEEEKAEEVVEEKVEVIVEPVQEAPTETPEPARSEADIAQEMNTEEVQTEEDAKDEAIASGEYVEPEVPKEEPAADKPKVQAKAKAEEEPKEEVEEDTSKKKPATKRNKKALAKAEPKEEVAATPQDFYTIPTTELTSFAEVLEAIKTPFVDEAWEAFKTEVAEDLASITIADDLNPGMLKVTLSELAIVREKLWLPLQEAKNEYERFTSKEPEGIIERVKRVNSVGGSNDTERRRSGVLACMNYETSLGTVNLYEALDDVRQRYNFLKAAMDSVKFKSDILITMNGALKLESNV